MRRPRSLPVLVVLVACQPPGPSTVAPARGCPDGPPGEGEVWVGALVCREQRFGTGDGRGEDYWLANSRLRAVVRHPAASLTLAGLGGGTLVDAAPWGRSDVIREIAPLVDGGWLVVDDLAVLPDGLALSGALRGLPDRPRLPDEGARRTVTWRIRPDDPWLALDGADGLWIHASANLTRLDGWLWGERVVIGHDGQVEEDLGGALRVAGATRLLIAEPAEALALMAPSTRRLAGAAEGATELRLYAGERELGRLPVSDGAFDAMVPAEVDAVEARGPGRGPSPRVPPGEALALELGAPAVLDLRVGWDGARPRPIRVAWQADDGREGTDLLDPLGEPLALGTGAHTLTLSAGPAVRPRTLRVELRAPEARLSTTLSAAFDPDPYVPAAFSWDAGRDRAVRADELDRMRAAVGEGLAWVVVTARDDVPTPDAFVSDRAWIRWTAGATLSHPDGWRVTAWPWRSAARQPGGGAPAIASLAPLDALALAWGGVSTDRTLRVDLDLLANAGTPPWELRPRPQHVALPPPGEPPFTAWQVWFDWLDAGRFLLPSGPRHWLDVEAPDRYGPVDLERAVIRGRFSTGTGAWLDLRVDSAGPGEVLEAVAADGPGPDLRTFPIALTLHTTGLPLDQVALITRGGAVAGRWAVEGDTLAVAADVELDTWVAAVAWSSTSDDWVVTAPTWTVPPASDPAPPSDDPLHSGDTAGGSPPADTGPESATPGAP